MAAASVAEIGGGFLTVVVVAVAVVVMLLFVVLVSGTLTWRLGWLLLVLNRRAPDEQMPELGGADPRPLPTGLSSSRARSGPRRRRRQRRRRRRPPTAS